MIHRSVVKVHSASCVIYLGLSGLIARSICHGESLRTDLPRWHFKTALTLPKIGLRSRCQKRMSRQNPLLKVRCPWNYDALCAFHYRNESGWRSQMKWNCYEWNFHVARNTRRREKNTWKSRDTFELMLQLSHTENRNILITQFDQGTWNAKERSTLKHAKSHILQAYRIIHTKSPTSVMIQINWNELRSFNDWTHSVTRTTIEHHAHAPS